MVAKLVSIFSRRLDHSARIYSLFRFSSAAKVSPINIAEALAIYSAFSAGPKVAPLIKIIVGGERFDGAPSFKKATLSDYFSFN